MSWLLKSDHPGARFELEAQIEREILALVAEARAAVAKHKLLEEEYIAAGIAVTVAKRAVDVTLAQAANQGFHLNFNIGNI